MTSKNIHSLKFHEKNGFDKCGEFSETSRKFGSKFRVIWMIKNFQFRSYYSN